MPFCLVHITKLKVGTANIKAAYNGYLTGTGNVIVVCISPLIAIMIEQQQKFMEKGIKVEFVGEAQSK